MLKKNYLKYYAAILVVSLLFICKGASVGLLIKDIETVFSPVSQAEGTHVCCGYALVSASFFSGVSFDFVIPHYASVLLYFAFFLGLIWYKLHKKPDKSQFDYYHQHIRQTIGSWKIFHNISSYFRFGILHPKIY